MVTSHRRGATLVVLDLFSSTSTAYNTIPSPTDF